MSNVTTADLCFSSRRPRSFNDRINVPFYIFAPDYRDNSGGIRVLHYLCHILNELGEEAYLVNTRIASPRLRTPLLTFSKLKQHFLAGQNPVTVYPEVVSDNPLNTPLIVRWLLNVPGHLGRPIEFEAKDLIYYYEAWCLPSQLKGRPLFIHPVDHTYFHNDNNPDDDSRVYECYYANKYFLGNKPVLEEHRGLISVGQEIKRSHEELGSIFRKAKVLYCYEPSGIISEAQACGCPVLLVRSDYWALPPDDTHHRIPGIAIYGEDRALQKASESLRRIPETHANARDNSWVMTKDFVEHAYRAQEELKADGKPLLNDLQKLWALDKKERSAAVDHFCDVYLRTSSALYFEDLDRAASLAAAPENEPTGYRAWRDRRQLQASDGALLEQAMRAALRRRPSFHIVLRVDQPQFPLLAKTLESLNAQIYSNWRVDVVSPAPSPGEALNSLPQLAWHTLPANEETKPVIDMLVSAQALDWVAELPPGAELDPLCLFRIAHETNGETAESPVAAFFVDDDIVDSSGLRRAPRFKPDFDPEWACCTDLLGPVFVRSEAWRQAGGAAGHSARPWYDLAMRLTATFGDCAIGHIAEPLLSLPATLTNDGHAETCRAALTGLLAGRGSAVKVVPVSDQAWRLKRPLPRTPLVTVAIPSRDKPEYLKDCVELVLSTTGYPDYEILIVDAASEEADTRALLVALTQRPEAPVRVVTLTGAFNAASFANAAAREAAGELLLLFADDLRITHPDWLEALVRHGLREEVCAVGPHLVAPPDGTIVHAGYIAGLGGSVGSPHQGEAPGGGYLDCLSVDRTVSALSASCMLVRRDDFLAAGGMDATDLASAYADVDFCLRLSAAGRRCVSTPSAKLIAIGGSSLEPFVSWPTERAALEAARVRAQETLLRRWFPALASDRFWSRHLDRTTCAPRLELRCVPSWHALPTEAPRILAFPVMNAQGDIRVIRPLQALRKAGMAAPCVFQPDDSNNNSPGVMDIARHRPDAIVAHHLVGYNSLAAIRQWRTFIDDAFIVYEVDDLLTDMPLKSSLRQGVPADARTFLAKGLRYCDRLVVSTSYLAEVYGPLAKEVRIVPNRLERDVWLPLSSRRNTGPRPRVGWAGGTTHEGDLQVIAEVIAATAHEVDWIFMGMCPDNIRPYIKEFHPFSDFAAYPARLAALNLDLAVAPLEQHPFNRGKSNLRLLEYGALGIPVVCTDIDPYRDSPACRVSNRRADWLRALRERVYDPDAAEREGLAMKEWVLRNYILEDHLDDWLQAHLPG